MLAEYTVQVLTFTSVLYFINYNRSTNGQIKYSLSLRFYFFYKVMHIDWQVVTDVPQARCASLFRVKLFGLLETISNLSIPWICVIRVHGVITATKCTVLINTTHY